MILDALPFSVSPDKALQKFYEWAYDDQGLSYLLQQTSVRIGAAYCPVWSFDVNIRFIIHESDGRRRFGWKPAAFTKTYGTQSVIHIPGLSAYAGYTYRRSLVNPVHNTSLVFLGNQAMPFGSWMLRDMALQGQRLEIFPDPWNSTQGRAFTVIKDELRAIAKQEAPNAEVQTEMVAARRVYMPTYVFDYKVFGVEYRAFVSGCDDASGVSGESHKVFDVDRDAYQVDGNFLARALGVAQAGARVLGSRGVFVVLQFLFALFSRLLLRLPLIGFAAGIFVGFRKILQPLIRHRWGSAEWERQRENEAYMEEFDPRDDFVDGGVAQQYFRNNRGRIIEHLSGESRHEQGNFDWYKDWEAWARRLWEQQQQQEGYGQSQQQNRYRERKPPPRVDYQWDFDPNDP